MPLSRCHILIVEDDRVIALELTQAVEAANGQAVGPAHTLAQGLAIIRAEKIHGALLDANLPDGDVSPIAEELIGRGIPVVIQTGIASPLQLKQRHPDLPVFVKPVPASRLVRAVAGLMPLDPDAPVKQAVL